MKEALDEVSSSIQLSIEASLLFPFGPGVNDGLHSPVLNGVNDAFGVIASVADKGATPCMRDQFFGGNGLVPLALCECDVNGASFGIDDGMELGRKASSRTAQSISLDPPFPPDAS